MWNSNKPFYKVLGFDNLPKGLIGLEIEMEGQGLPSFNNREVATLAAAKHWRVTMDGSLQGEALEYVSTGIQTPAEVEQGLIALGTLFQEKKPRIHDSVRAGVHVHINVLELTPKQILTFASLFYIFEESLVNIAGPQRAGNLFCLRLIDAQLPIKLIIRAIKNKEFKSLASSSIRYAALNWNSLSKHGSLEFRFIRTPSTFEVGFFKNWCDLFAKLKQDSLTYGSPVELIESFSGKDPVDFASQFLPKQFLDLVSKSPGDLARELQTGVRFVQDYAYLLERSNRNNG